MAIVLSNLGTTLSGYADPGSGSSLSIVNCNALLEFNQTTIIPLSRLGRIWQRLRDVVSIRRYRPGRDAAELAQLVQQFVTVQDPSTDARIEGQFLGFDANRNLIIESEGIRYLIYKESFRSNMMRLGRSIPELHRIDPNQLTTFHLNDGSTVEGFLRSFTTDGVAVVATLSRGEVRLHRSDVNFDRTTPDRPLQATRVQGVLPAHNRRQALPEILAPNASEFVAMTRARVEGLVFRVVLLLGERRMVYYPEVGRRQMKHDPLNQPDQFRDFSAPERNQYVRAFEHLRDLGFSMIDLESPEQQAALRGYAAANEAPGVFVGRSSFASVYALERHRILAAEYLNMPIVIRVSSVTSYN